MSRASRRHILLALAALSAGAAWSAAASAQGVPDLSAGRGIGEAYLAEHPSADLAALRQTLLPEGLTAEAMTALRQRAGQDFAAGRTFAHNGWRLSETEAQLFALLTGLD